MIEKIGRREGVLKSNKGQEMVEFALAFPLFAILSFGCIETGWLFFQQNIINYATRQGARYASTDPDTSWQSGTNISTAAQNVIKDFVYTYARIPQSETAITLDWKSVADRTFTVTTTCSYKPLFGHLIPVISDRTSNLARVTMYCESCG